MWPFSSKDKKKKEDTVEGSQENSEEKKMTLRDPNVQNVIKKTKKSRKDIMKDLFKE